MKLSVCIPTLNEEKYLAGLLSDLTHQTFTAFEVIVIDAKSADRTLAEASRFKSTLSLTIITSSVRDQRHQRNLGAQKAASDLLIFLDADSRIESRFLEKIMTAYRVRPFDVASSWITPISSRLTDKITFHLFNLLYLEPLKYIKPAGVGAFVFSTKSAFNHLGGFSSTYRFTEDFDFFDRAHKAHLRYRLFSDPQIQFSVRRLDREGRLNWILKMLRCGYYLLTNSPQKLNTVSYEFGQHR